MSLHAIQVRFYRPCDQGFSHADVIRNLDGIRESKTSQELDFPIGFLVFVVGFLDSSAFIFWFSLGFRRKPTGLLKPWLSLMPTKP